LWPSWLHFGGSGTNELHGCAAYRNWFWLFLGPIKLAVWAAPMTTLVEEMARRIAIVSEQNGAAPWDGLSKDYQSERGLANERDNLKGFAAHI
jgi:hypothetical protein